MKSRSTLLLLLLVAVVAGVVFWDYKWGTTTETARLTSRRIASFRSSDITQIELVLTNQTVVIDKAGDHWELKQPLVSRADSAAINAILDGLEFAEKRRTFTAKDLQTLNLADFGLLAPTARVRLHGKKEPLVFLLGSETPTRDAIYVQVEGAPDVYVTSKELAQRILRPVVELRDRVVMNVNPAAAIRLEMKSAERVLELTKTATANGGETRWSLVRPIGTRADQRQVADLLSNLAALRIQEFVSEDPKDIHTYQLNEPAREITISRSGTEPPVTLVLSAPQTNGAGRVYGKLKQSDSIFAIALENVQKLDVPVAELRDRQLLNFDPAQLKTLELQRGADRLILTQTNGEWRLTSPVEIAADDEQLQKLFIHLRSLRVSQFVADVATDLEKFGLTVPALIVRLQTEGASAPTQLLIGGTDESNTVRYVKRESEPFVYGVDAQVIQALPDSPWNLRTRQLTDFQPATVTSVAIRSSAGELRVERDAEQKWRLIEPAQGALNLDDLNQLLAAVAALRVEEFYPTPAAALASPATTITITTPGQVYVLQIAGQDASWNAPELAFRISEAAANTLQKPLVATPATP